MTDEPQQEHPPSWLTKLSHLLLREPQDRLQLVALLRDAKQRELFDSDALAMLEGVLNVSDMRVESIMIPRKSMICIKSSDSSEKSLDTIIHSKHSRFPIFDEHEREVIGIVHAKDILRAALNQEMFELEKFKRQPVFIPINKRLDVLLKDFKVSQNHMAIIIDEFNAVVGLATIEDILEQIVGNIEDEFDDAQNSKAS